ncbi:unnamed protein product [Rotaria sordida]|uniref:Uncharacterized protein n=1 Tax=Rotaria sordida TaxID=392033 RepID=A0A820CYA0_9BILA|nr:unnamed protein product [Rotaria sordida]
MYLSFLLLSALVGSTIGCSCIFPPSLSDSFAQTPIIFIGRVISTNVKQSNPFMGYADMTMEVEEAFKGTVAGAQITVRTNLQGAMCGFGAIPVDARWQLWLTESKSANICSRSTGDADRDLDELRKLSANSL